MGGWEGDRRRGKRNDGKGNTIWWESEKVKRICCAQCDIKGNEKGQYDKSGCFSF